MDIHLITTVSEIRTMAHQQENKTGYLELIAGPMYSGKTSKILELYKQYNFCGINCFVINYSDDNRYSTSQLVSHDKKEIPCNKALNLTELVDLTGDQPAGTEYNLKEFNNAQVILINEGQFFEDIVDWVKISVEKYHKVVYICGLDGDFKRNHFGNWLDLLPFCDKFEKLHSFCSHCKQRAAIFSHRLSHETAQKVIGTDIYVPLCRGCYISMNE
jgi:thymidine kinase